MWSIDPHGLLDHLEGTTVEPADPITPDVQGGTTQLDAKQALVDKEWKREVKEWRQREAVVKQQIARTIPDSCCSCSCVPKRKKTELNRTLKHYT